MCLFSNSNQPLVIHSKSFLCTFFGSRHYLNKLFISSHPTLIPPFWLLVWRMSLCSSVYPKLSFNYLVVSKSLASWTRLTNSWDIPYILYLSCLLRVFFCDFSFDTPCHITKFGVLFVSVTCRKYSRRYLVIHIALGKKFMFKIVL